MLHITSKYEFLSFLCIYDAECTIDNLMGRTELSSSSQYSKKKKALTHNSHDYLSWQSASSISICETLSLSKCIIDTYKEQSAACQTLTFNPLTPR